MKYGLLTYEENAKHFNVGDYIQSLAAKQYLPSVDKYLNREHLGDYTGEKTAVILNGWFTHNTSHWIPSGDILPLFVSFHLNNTAAPEMLSDEGIAYLKSHEPIGCRDTFTVDLLNSKGIKAFFTGCLTLTLDSYKVPDDQRTNDIFIVDPLYNYPTAQGSTISFRTFLHYVKSGKIWGLGRKKSHLNNLFTKELIASAKYTFHDLPSNTYSIDQKFEIADDLLRKYAKAKLVITSRIHCALPCLALRTPVIYINGFTDFVDTSRFGGILNLFNRVDIDYNTGKFTSTFPLDGKITSSTVIPNPDSYKILANGLKTRCRNFIDSTI